MEGEKEERAGRREGDQSTDFHTDDSDGSPLVGGSRRDRGWPWWVEKSSSSCEHLVSHWSPSSGRPR